MTLQCDPAYACREDIDAALADLQAATSLLNLVVFDGSPEIIEEHYAQVRMCGIRLKAVMSVYREHVMSPAGALP